MRHVRAPPAVQPETDASRGRDVKVNKYDVGDTVWAVTLNYPCKLFCARISDIGVGARDGKLAVDYGFLPLPDIEARQDDVFNVRDYDVAYNLWKERKNAETIPPLPSSHDPTSTAPVKRRSIFWRMWKLIRCDVDCLFR
jgi:hypothetical protein